MKTKKCEICKKEFVPKSNRQKYCSKTHIINCSVCGKEIEKESRRIDDFPICDDSFCISEKIKKRLNSKLKPNDSFIPIKDGSRTCTLIAKQYNFYEFYKTELNLWKENKTYKQEKSLQEYIYNNRKKYINKEKEDLSDYEILSAFKIAGIYNSYSVFNNQLFKEVIDKYNIKSVLDYCSGWGERLITCAAKDIKYLGIDINKEVVKGHNNIIKDYKLNKQKSIVGDASSVIIDNFKDFDISMSCPPYYNIEIYSNKGAENLPTYESFLNWWNKVIKNIGHTKYFAFQMTTKYSEDMKKIVEDNGYNHIDSIYYKNKSVSHLNKKTGTKYEEVMLVFKKTEN
jgi:hypothetical protein